MKQIWYITLKEIRDFFLDKGDLAFSLIMPILIFGLMYGAFGGQTQFNGTVFIVNEDTGSYSRLLLNRLGRQEGLTVKTLMAAEADSRLDRSNIQMAIFIPSDFSAELEAGRPTKILFKQRGNGGMEGQITASIVQGAVERISQEILLQNNLKADLRDSGASEQQVTTAFITVLAREQADPAIIIVKNSLGNSPDPVNQFLPGIMTMFVLFSVNLAAQALVEERRKGTLERLLTTRLKVSQIFTGKFLAYTARGFIQTVMLMLLAYAVFGIFTPLTFLEALLLALLFAAACSTLGIIIGSIARTQNASIWIAVFFTMTMVMLAGTFMAVTEGTTLDMLSQFSINTHANDAFREIIFKGGSLESITSEILILVSVTLVGLIISRFLFKATQGGK